MRISKTDAMNTSSPLNKNLFVQPYKVIFSDNLSFECFPDKGNNSSIQTPVKTDVSPFYIQSETATYLIPLVQIAAGQYCN